MEEITQQFASQLSVKTLPINLTTTQLSVKTLPINLPTTQLSVKLFQSYTAKWTGAMWGEQNCPSFETAARGFKPRLRRSNPYATAPHTEPVITPTTLLLVCYRVHPTVTFPIGDHVNILHDYKITGPSKILKLLTCRCHYLNDMLVNCSQSLVIFTNFCMNYYTNCQKSFHLLKSSKNPQLHCQHVLPANLPMCLLKCSHVR